MQKRLFGERERGRKFRKNTLGGLFDAELYCRPEPIFI